MAAGSTRLALLQLLAQRQGKPVSGQELAQRLGVSRAAVWKAAKALQAQGYAVQGCSGRGYTLPALADLLTPEAVLAAAPRLLPRVEVRRQVDSTNRLAARLALEGAPHGTLVLAEGQTQGRGRLGRSFCSPAGKGLYMSLLLRPQGWGPQCALAVTGSAAVAVCRAVARLCGLQLGIKWVNDLYLGGKKVCGILTEAATDVESGEIGHLAVGIGLNLTATDEDFGPQLAPIAGSLYPGGAPPCTRAQLAAAIAGELLSLCPGFGYLPEYRAASIVLGHYLTVQQGGRQYTARARAIDGQGRLVIELPTGGRQALASGEVSIRPAGLPFPPAAPFAPSGDPLYKREPPPMEPPLGV